MSNRESKTEARQGRPAERFPEKDRLRFVEGAHAEQGFKLANFIPGQSDECQAIWAIEKNVPKFSAVGWKAIHGSDGSPISITSHGSVTGKEIHHGLEIKQIWYDERKVKQEQKNAASRKEANIGQGTNIANGQASGLKVAGQGDEFSNLPKHQLYKDGS